MVACSFTCAAKNASIANTIRPVTLSANLVLNQQIGGLPTPYLFYVHVAQKAIVTGHGFVCAADYKIVPPMCFPNYTVS